jgi:LPXTG-motif cell wall-anchored protein
MFACTTGVTLGIVSLADTKSAAERQYVAASPNLPGGGVRAEHGGGSRDPGGNGNGYQGSDVAGDQGSGAQIPAGELGGARLADADRGSLPFTGYAVLPVFGIGLLLIGAGLFLRRRSSSAEL